MEIVMTTSANMQVAMEREANDADHEGVDAFDDKSVREVLRGRLKRVKKRAAEAQVIVVEKGKKTARVADEYVHDRPWTTAATALGVGVLIGLLIGRR
ncbi:ElaB protein [Burkholderia orbicola]